MKESIMSVAALVGSFDDIVRSTSVLAEGIEGGLCFDSLFAVSSFLIVFVLQTRTIWLVSHDFVTILYFIPPLLLSIFPNLRSLITKLSKSATDFCTRPEGRVRNGFRKIQLFFFYRIYQIRITTRRMSKEVACSRKRSCPIETRHRENHGTDFKSCQFPFDISLLSWLKIFVQI